MLQASSRLASRASTSGRCLVMASPAAGRVLVARRGAGVAPWVGTCVRAARRTWAQDSVCPLAAVHELIPIFFNVLIISMLRGWQRSQQEQAPPSPATSLARTSGTSWSCAIGLTGDCCFVCSLEPAENRASSSQGGPGVCVCSPAG